MKNGDRQTDKTSRWSSLEDFIPSVWVSLAHLAIWELSNPDSIWIEYVLLSICKFNCLDPILLDSLNGAIREDALLLSILKDELCCAVRESIKQKMVRLSWD